jgi:hypothetical protein
MKKHLLCLVKSFPPYRTEPVTVMHVKHLARLGWDVDVVHGVPGWGYNTFALTYDPEQAAALPKSVRRHPVKLNLYRNGLKRWLKGKKSQAAAWSGKDNPSLFKRFLRSIKQIPDNQSYWVWSAVRRTLKVIREQRPSVLLTSAPPFSTHLAGYIVHKLTGIPWVNYSRDLWRLNTHYEPHLPWRVGLDKLLERKVIGAAQSVVTVYPETTTWLQLRYENPGQRYSTVRNGYDEGDFSTVEPYKAAPERFTLLHAGLLEPIEGDGRTGYALLKGLRLWLERRPELREKVRLELIGKVAPIYKKIVEEYGLSDCVEILPPVTLNEVISRELGADLLLIIFEDNPKMNFYTGGKIHECARAGKPILGILSEKNAASRVIKQLNLGRVAKYGDDEDVSRKLEAMYDEITAGSLDYGGRGRDYFVETTSYEKLAERFGEILAGQLD